MITTKIYQKLFEKYGNTPCSEIIERAEAELAFLQKKDYLNDLSELDTFIERCKADGEPYCAVKLTSTSFMLNILGITACNPLGLIMNYRHFAFRFVAFIIPFLRIFYNRKGRKSISVFRL